jgi:hypothetical protein
MFGNSSSDGGKRVSSGYGSMWVWRQCAEGHRNNYWFLTEGCDNNSAGGMCPTCGNMTWLNYVDVGEMIPTIEENTE